LKRITQGAADALTLTAGQVAVRTIPGLLRLPMAGPVGLAISTATAVLAGMAAEQVLGREAARIFTAGAVSVPLQAAAMTYIAPMVPLVGAALTPTLGSYPRRGRLGAYPRRALPSGRGRVGVSSYPYALGIFQ